jgi:hypothetical protein
VIVDMRGPPDESPGGERGSGRSAALLGPLEAAGLLLLQDRVLPSAAALVAGEPIAGS